MLQLLWAKKEMWKPRSSHPKIVSFQQTPMMHCVNTAAKMSQCNTAVSPCCTAAVTLCTITLHNAWLTILGVYNVNICKQIPIWLNLGTIVYENLNFFIRLLCSVKTIYGRSSTISSHFFAIYMNTFHKTEVQTVILRCWTGLNLNWFKSRRGGY